MAKVVRHLRSGQQEFQKVFSKLCNIKSAWQVWSDFVEMFAISISNGVEVRPKVKQDRENRYMSIINAYPKSEQALFSELVGILVNSLEKNPEQDFLGEMFMGLELGSPWKGQFFTPYSLCQMMAAINIPDAKERVDTKGWVAINDPACGAGATLIGARNALQKAGIGSSKAWFVGQDIDRVAGMMCYIQLSLLGCAGYVVIADTLLHPLTGPLLWPNLTQDQDAWFMPMNVLDPVWVLRSMGRQPEYEIPKKKPTDCDSTQVEREVEEAVVVPVVEQPAEQFNATDSGQLTLF